jgi:hypothetical protein
MRFKLTFILITLGILFSDSPPDTTHNYELFNETMDKRLEKIDSLIHAKITTLNIEAQFEELNKEFLTVNSKHQSDFESLKANLDIINNDLSSYIKSLSDSLINTNINIIKIKDNYTFEKAFLKARLEKGKDNKFEWRDKIFSTNYPNEIQTPPIVLEIESLKANIELKNQQLDDAISKANSLITEVENRGAVQYQSLGQTMSTQSLYWIIAILIILILLIVVFLVLKSKVSEQNVSITSVRNIQGKLEKEAIQLDTKLIQVLEQKIDLEELQSSKGGDVDHSLPLKLGEEIHRMRKRLKTMDESQGTKVLNKRIESLEEKLNELGYEIVELEGKPFNDGMTVEAEFVPDDNLKSGIEIINRVIKPQINFNGKLIQSAKVEVGQGK